MVPVPVVPVDPPLVLELVPDPTVELVPEGPEPLLPTPLGPLLPVPDVPVVSPIEPVQLASAIPTDASPKNRRHAGAR
jgi:hypothetical protein